MEAQKVKPGDWISIQGAMPIQGYVFKVLDNDRLSVGYLQNGSIPVREAVVWTGERWSFESATPNGIVLHGSEARIVQRGQY